MIYAVNLGKTLRRVQTELAAIDSSGAEASTRKAALLEQETKLIDIIEETGRDFYVGNVLPKQLNDYATSQINAALHPTGSPTDAPSSAPTAAPTGALTAAPTGRSTVSPMKPKVQRLAMKPPKPM